MSGNLARRHLSTLAEVRAIMADPTAWSEPDTVGRRTCAFDLSSRTTPSRAVVTEHPAGMLVETRGGDCRVEIVLDGAYEVAGELREVGTVIVHQPGRSGGPAMVGPRGATILEVFARPPAAVDEEALDLHDHART